MQPLKSVISSAEQKSSVNSDNHLVQKTMKSGGCLKRSLPNFMTFLRLCAVPLTAYFLLADQSLYAFLTFAFAGLTDWADGFFARLWQVESKFGQIFDPLADKALVILSSLLLGYMGHIPYWFVGLIAGRDLFLIMGGVYIFFSKINLSLAPIFVSKINTFAQIIFLGCVMLFDYRLTISYADVGGMSLLSIFMYALMFIVVITTILSGLSYLLMFMNRQKMVPEKGQREVREIGDE